MSRFGDLIHADIDEVPAPKQIPSIPAEEVLVVEETLNLSKLTKKQLEDYGRTVGIELDRRYSKKKLIAQLNAHLNSN